MAIKPPAMIYQCRQCGWKCIYAPLSDALLAPPPKTCEKCGNSELVGTPADAVDKLMGAMGVITASKTYPL